MELTDLAVQARAEEGLVERARQGDRDAFALLIGPRTDRVLRTARAILGNEAEAHDAAQAAFISAWVNLPRLRDAARFDAWLTRVLVNECRATLRLRRRSQEIVLERADMRGPDTAAGSLDGAALRAAFQRISVEDRTILLLHHLHDLPLDQVARHLQIPLGTAKSRLWSARRALERALEAEA
jgi:RNA polymerase sigma-70 factor (ECF subfamily)